MNLLTLKMQARSPETVINSESENKPSRSYQSIFKQVIQELLDREQEQKTPLDADVFTSAQLKEDTRRKLALMFKTNFERYNDGFRQILKRRDSKDNKKDVKITREYRIIYTPEVSSPISDLVVLDKEWLKEITKFPSYPSGNIAMMICNAKDTGSFIYLIFKDEEQLQLQGICDHLGHATFHDKDNNIWVYLGLDVGFYFDKNGRQKAWNWWDPNLHLHAPPNQSISFKLNPCVSVHIKSQDKVFVTFSYYKQKLYLNLGSKLKAKDTYSDIKLQNQPVLDTYELEKIFQVIKTVLKKMKELSCKTRLDLENFVKGSPCMSMVENHLRAGKLSSVLTSYGRIRPQ